jgi:hypothetical protein
MYSRRQRALVQQVIEAARDGRLCIRSAAYWVIVKEGCQDLVVQINFDTATLYYLNASEAYDVLRANPPHKDSSVAKFLEKQLTTGSPVTRSSTFL